MRCVTVVPDLTLGLRQTLAQSINHYIYLELFVGKRKVNISPKILLLHQLCNKMAT